MTDSTHVNTNTSLKSEQIAEVEYKPAEYLSVLDSYEPEERKGLEQAGRILPQKCLRTKRKRIKQSKTKDRNGRSSGPPVTALNSGFDFSKPP